MAANVLVTTEEDGSKWVPLEEFEKWQQYYYNLADAIAPESISCEQLCDIARSTRQERDRLRDQARLLTPRAADGCPECGHLVSHFDNCSRAKVSA